MSDSAEGEHQTQTGISVGTAAARLGVSPATLRSWGRRYGLEPAGWSSGGHRRYTAADLARLTEMQKLVGGGIAPSKAARIVMVDGAVGEPAEDDPDEAAQIEDWPAFVTGRTRGTGGRVLAVPGSTPEVRGLARAAGRLDTDAIAAIVGGLLSARGVAATWDNYVRPVMVAAGLRWERTGQGVDIEHLLSETVIETLRTHRARQLHPHPGRPVLLACSPEDMHVVPLHVIAASLAELQVPTRILGARVPVDALASAARRIGASAVFIWRQLASDTSWDPGELPRMRPPLMVVAGGTGWDVVPLPRSVMRADSLSAAIRMLRTAPR